MCKASRASHLWNRFNDEHSCQVPSTHNMCLILATSTLSYSDSAHRPMIDAPASCETQRPLDTTDCARRGSRWARNNRVLILKVVMRTRGRKEKDALTTVANVITLFSGIYLYSSHSFFLLSNPSTASGISSHTNPYSRDNAKDTDTTHKTPSRGIRGHPVRV